MHRAAAPLQRAPAVCAVHRLVDVAFVPLLQHRARNNVDVYLSCTEN